MMQFQGFPPGKTKLIRIPAQFFSDVLPMITDPIELKVVLFFFQALQQKEGEYRYLRWDDLQHEDLQRGLLPLMPDQPFDEILQHGLNMAIEHAIVLASEVDWGHRSEIIYFMNTQKGRYAVQQIQQGNWTYQEGENPLQILPERPTVYTLYEQNIGTLTPIIADQIKDAEAEYTTSWLEDAIRAAVENNARSWRYIIKVLERWQEEGKHHEITGRDNRTDGKRYAEGEFKDFIES